MKKYFFIKVLCLFLSLPVIGQEIKLDQWLVLGPMPLSERELEKQKDPAEILSFRHIPLSNLKPDKASPIYWQGKDPIPWKVTSIKNIKSTVGHIIYMAVYLDSRSWTKRQLILNCPFPIAVYWDGEFVKSKTNDQELSLDLSLNCGKHVLILKGLLTSNQPNGIGLEACLKPKDGFGSEPVEISFDYTHRLNIEDLLNSIDINSFSISPDGNYLAVFLSQQDKKDDRPSSWLEVIELDNSKTVFNSAKIGKITQFRWLNKTGVFSYALTDEKMTSILTYNLLSNSWQTMAENLENFSRYWWAHNDQFLIYTTSIQEKTGKDAGYKIVRKIPERGNSQRDRSQVYILFPGSGTIRKLFDQKDDINDVIISPDNRQALCTHTDDDFQNRPYELTTVYLLDIFTFKNKKLFSDPWLRQYYWSPDGQKLLLIGGASAFDGLGKNLSDKEKIPNDFDNQAYIYDLKTQAAVPISKNFNPSIDSAFWHPVDQRIYFRVTDQSCVNIYQYDVKRKSYDFIHSGVDVVERINFATKKRIAVFIGSSTANPQKLYRLDLASGSASLLKDFNRSVYAKVVLDKVENWNFKNKEGKTIIGHVYYPSDFDAKKKYPCIVNFYGGTSPVLKDFGGRYPKNWYAANGYFVYVLQPSGATGFGQDFSSIHVNDWGKTTSDEIIDGVNKFIKAHPYVDPQKIGAIGASYGGFLIQLLGTKTDIFAALISHAGISALSSYWGVGDWGYTYSAVATADSFPWNRKDIYVGHSPLFMADRFHSPLLLLHGEIDNNVPPGESYQMYAALKLLNKEVTLITFANQQHWILEYGKRVQWMKTIIAWFDKYLKKEPLYWEDLYGKEKS